MTTIKSGRRKKSQMQRFTLFIYPPKLAWLKSKQGRTRWKEWLGYWHRGISCGKRARGLRREGWDWGAGDGAWEASLTAFSIEALDKGRIQALVGDLTGVDIMTFVLWTGQCQDAAEAIGVVLAVLLCGTVLDAIGLDDTIYFPFDIDFLGVEAIQQAHNRSLSGL